ncbi:MAG: indolepyruvate oxidoreductase subunit beta [Candidatus Bipolaricaulis sp.]|nr:indolepyruvate oxidoreductase subunit beta [Candidatus Bipolaricaulis sp.]MDD5265330.1 indolepyruvate oxidoreductase subunit beta [Candidatus Bipolaricaulis sp.]
MKRDIILAGVGGQGLLAVAAVLGEAVRSLGLRLKQAEVHGMAQRGGAVQSHVRFSDRPIYSDLVREGTADLVLALEPMEALRYIAYLRPDGVLVSDTRPVRNIPDYPDLARILAELAAISPHRLVDAALLAEKAGSAQATNLVVLGAASPFLELPEAALVGGIRAVFAGKPDAVLAANLRGFELGAEWSRAVA